MKTKSLTAVVMAFAMSLAFTGCDLKSSAPYYSSTEEVTIDKIIEKSQPVNMLEYKGGFKQTISYSGFGDENLDNAEIYLCYKKTSDLIEVNQAAVYPDDYFTYVYMSNDRNDPFVYSRTSMGGTKDDFSDEDLNSLLNDTVLGYVTYKADLVEVNTEEDKYVATINISLDGEEVGTDYVTIDPATGYVLYVKSSDSSSGQEVSINSEFTYTSDITIDTTPKTEYSEPVQMEAETE